MVDSCPNVLLNNDKWMPCLGLGTFNSKDNEGELAVKMAIDAGYRHIDTAYLYENETQVGKAIADKIAEGVVQRKDLFITTKLWSTYHEANMVEHACRKSLQKLGLKYVDLYLIHWPIGIVYRGDDVLYPKDGDDKLETNDVDYIETWRAMENLVKIGLARSIGVSNFNIEQLQRVLDIAEIKPVNNQIECSPHIVSLPLINFCKKNKILITAYTPLGRPNVEAKTPEYMFDSQVEAIGKKYNKTIGQVVLRYLYELGVYPLPKSSTKSRIEQNINIFDFALSANEKKYMETFAAANQRVVALEMFSHHKYYPF